eukprot:14966934-Alexandrium_andersonii.AAC.1
MPRLVHTNLAWDMRAARGCGAEYSRARASLCGRQWHLCTKCATRELRSTTAAPCLAWPCDARRYSEHTMQEEEARIGPMEK